MTIQEELFAQVQEAFEGCQDLGSGQLCRIAGDYFTGGQLDVCGALVKHWADLHEDEDPFDFMEKSWTEMIVETVRRTFYDEAGAALHGTSFIYNSHTMLRLVSAEMIKYATHYQADNMAFAPQDLPDNVLVFPEPNKTRQ